jgi:hypothetical protein
VSEQAPTLNGAREQLNTLCVAVGLTQVDSLPTVDHQDAPPAGATLWQSAYANVLLWPCEANCLDDIIGAAERGQGWFDQVLSSEEAQRNGRVVDGYLVLALSQRPPTETRDDIRRLELSSLICRKHLIWPSTLDDQDHVPGLWRRVADVTVVGLPAVDVQATGDLYWPELDEDAKSQLDELQQLTLQGVLIKDRAGQ